MPGGFEWWLWYCNDITMNSLVLYHLYAGSSVIIQLVCYCWQTPSSVAHSGWKKNPEKELLKSWLWSACFQLGRLLLATEFRWIKTKGGCAKLKTLLLFALSFHCSFSLPEPAVHLAVPCTSNFHLFLCFFLSPHQLLFFFNIVWRLLLPLSCVLSHIIILRYCFYFFHLTCLLMQFCLLLQVLLFSNFMCFSCFCRSKDCWIKDTLLECACMIKMMISPESN